MEWLCKFEELKNLGGEAVVNESSHEEGEDGSKVEAMRERKGREIWVESGVVMFLIKEGTGEESDEVGVWDGYGNGCIRIERRSGESL